MASSKYRSRSRLDERLYVTLSTSQKERLFSLADREQISSAALVRRALNTLLAGN